MYPPHFEICCESSTRRPPKEVILVKKILAVVIFHLTIRTYQAHSNSLSELINSEYHARVVQTPSWHVGGKEVLAPDLMWFP
jgi:hypothetical protein